MAKGSGSSAASSSLPTWLVLWLIAASPVVVWDFTFLLMRPASLPGGDMHWLYKPYGLYVEVDRRYGDMEDTFGLAQAWMNVVEVLLSCAAVALHFMASGGAVARRRCRLLAFMTLTMTWWKTVCYMIQYMDLCNGGAYIAGIDQFSFIFMFLIPNGLWLVFPLLGMVHLWTLLTAADDGKKSQ